MRLVGPLISCAATLLVLAVASLCPAEQSPAPQQPPSPAAATDLPRHIDELFTRLDALRRQLDQTLNEMDSLRSEVRTLREQLAAGNSVERNQDAVDSLRQSVAQIQDETSILQAEVKQHDQVKVESASKYPVHINGTILLTSFYNTGNVDDLNLPAIALPKQTNATGSLSTTAAQTILGLEAFGPHVGSALTSADIAMDFFTNDSPSGPYSFPSTSLRLRTAHARIEWPNTAVTVALDRSLLSPIQPASWLTTAEPAMAWSGNLWSWQPQIQIQRSNILPHHGFDVAFGLIDAASPENYSAFGQALPSTSERSHQPGYEARLSSSEPWHDRTFTWGASGYYSRKAFSTGNHIDAWAGAADWNMPLTHVLAFSGEFYRGRSLAGLGGGAYKDFVISGDAIYGLDAVGGWAQFKATLSSTLEANISYGLDDAFSADLYDVSSAGSQNYYANLARNATGLANIVYRPKSYLLISPEFRVIRSRTIVGQVSEDRVFGVATGYIF